MTPNSGFIDLNFLPGILKKTDLQETGLEN